MDCHSKKYKPIEIRFIEYYYESKGPKYICDHLRALGISDRQPKNLKQKGRLMGLRYKGPRLGTFKKGLIPANKGKKMPAYIYEKAKATMFKRGQLPHNTKPVGTIVRKKSVNGKYYTEIKTAPKTWEFYHRYLYRTQIGPIPDNHVVRFKDGNTDNFELSNLEVIDKTKNIILNMYADYPEEIQELHYLNTKLKKELTNATK